MTIQHITALLLLLFVTTDITGAEDTIAFPGAEGYGDFPKVDRIPRHLIYR
ncbi:hypothetical protein OAF37_03040 [Rubripirellula sp.]|nr:hypothetical protein [Rubripirellula sp.]MDB4621854.1 hypothetical protein [Rubripirellula sp.]MDB4645013.1 hypothetical protein [Rubripirellula sp.]MDB4770820.1 hypothetical protein [bacterium]